MGAGYGTDLLYAPGEGVFSLAGPMIWAAGWSVFPQERSGARRPGRAGGASILWGRLCDQAASPDEIALWAAECAQLNVALALGPASGDVFVIDIDCLDPALSRQVQDIAFRILGATPFVRIGRAPKVALLYRGNGQAMPHYFSKKFLDAGNGQASDNGLEVLPKGRALTVYGLHHVTGRYFHWPDLNPLSSPPSEAPLVSAQDVEAFLAEVGREHPFFQGREAAAGFMLSAEDWGDAGGLKVPVVRDMEGYPTDTDGRVTDMREKYLTGLVFHVVTGNKNSLLRAWSDGAGAWTGFVGRMCKASCDVFRETALMDSKWERKLERDVFGKVSHLASKVASSPNDFPTLGTGRGARTFTVLPSAPTPSVAGGMGAVSRTERGVVDAVNTEVAGVTSDAPASPSLDQGELSWMRRSPRVPIKGWHEPAAADAPGFPIDADRGPVSTKVSQGIDRALGPFMDEAYDDGCEPRLYILDAPTGSGKTTLTLQKIATDPRTYAPSPDGKPHKPMVVLVPTYGNIYELRSRAKILNLDGSLPDAELAAAARDIGLLNEGEAASRIAELRRDALNCAALARQAGAGEDGFRTAVYSGRVKAGCAFPEKVGLAMTAGIGASAFCKAHVLSRDGESVQETCIHYDTCPAISQKDEALRAHLVFMPHAFLALQVPEELLDVRAVIADERVHHLFLHVGELHLSTLLGARRPPRLTKAEVADNLNPQELLADRNTACRAVMSALGRGECPAQALMDLKGPPMPGWMRPRGMILAENALRVCGDGVKRDGQISPSTSFEAVRAYCARPVGKELREEMQFWRIVLERMKALLHDQEFRPDEAISNARAAVAALPDDAPVAERVRLERRASLLARAGGRKARGTRDTRLQLVEDGEGADAVQKLRISWRTAPNWEGVPTLLLDASAAPDIAAKIWGVPRERVVVHKVVEDFGRVLNVKVVAVTTSTFSNSYVAGHAASSGEESVRHASRLARVREAMSAVCAVHADGRVFAGAGMLLREAVSESWCPPMNLDWCHYGAMRGLDSLKFHAASISVGRMELPVRTIDGLVAALSYDDPDPEEPFDTRGDGRDPENPSSPKRLPMVPRAVRMRDGSTVWVEMPCYPGRWAALMQKQYREEELLQLVGRLRPVYREGRAPVWYMLTSIIPDGIIVDDVMDIDDMMGGLPSGPLLWDAARRCAGVLEPSLMFSRCPDIFPSREDARRALVAAGFDPEKGGEPPGRAWAGWSWWHAHAEVEPGDEAQGMHLIVARYASDKQHVENMLADVAFMPSARRMGDPPQAQPMLDMARPRPGDTVEERLGSHAARRAREQVLVDAAGAAALSGDGFDLSARMVRWEAKGHVAYMTPMEICAMQALDTTWQRRSAMSNTPSPPLREGDESPTWDRTPVSATS